MFKRKKSTMPIISDRPAVDTSLLASMPNDERIQTRAMAIGVILGRIPQEIGKKSAPGGLHLITVDEASARAHADFMKALLDVFGFTIAKLSSGESEKMRAKVYQADLVVGSLADFTADLGCEIKLKIRRYAVMIEGGPESASTNDERALLANYRKTIPG